MWPVHTRLADEHKSLFVTLLALETPASYITCVSNLHTYSCLTLLCLHAYVCTFYEACVLFNHRVISWKAACAVQMRYK